MRKTLLFLLFYSSVVLFFYGCATRQKDTLPKTEAMIEPATILKFSDVPIPAGFNLLPKDSYSFESGNMRAGILKYQGKANPEQVVNFYKEQMAMYNWNLLNTIEYGEWLLNFERETETCIIVLSSKGNSVTLTISLGPKAQALPKKSKEPVK